MTLLELLESSEHLDITLSSQVDPVFDLVWADEELTTRGKSHFNDILNLQVIKKSDSVYELITEGKENLEDLLAHFLRVAAGYCSEDTFNKYINAEY